MDELRFGDSGEPIQRWSEELFPGRRGIGRGPAIPGADILADVAAEDVVAGLNPEFFGDR